MSQGGCYTELKAAITDPARAGGPSLSKVGARDRLSVGAAAAAARCQRTWHGTDARAPGRAGVGAGGAPRAVLSVTTCARIESVG